MSNWVWSSILAVGQVPQTGLLLSDNGESRLNSDGSETIFVTHQLDISWLNEDASKTYTPYQ